MYSSIKDTINLDQEQIFYTKTDEHDNVEIHTSLPGTHIPTEIVVTKAGKTFKAVLKKVKYTESRDMFEITYKRYK